MTETPTVAHPTWCTCTPCAVIGVRDALLRIIKERYHLDDQAPHA